MLQYHAPLKMFSCDLILTLVSWQKLAYFGDEEEGRYADDMLKTYGNEGAGSLAGSVGCCSLLGEQESMDFLNTLGPKFRPLADVCYTTKKTGK